MQFATLRVIILFALFLDIHGFRITNPQPEEMIDVSKAYNLTWTFDDIGADTIVSSIRITFPDPALLTDSNYAYLSYEVAQKYRIAATQGYYPLWLEALWSPVYNELPHGLWSLILEMNSTGLTAVVNISLTSSSTSLQRRPLLSPIQDLGYNPVLMQHEPAGASSNIWQTVLSIVIPVLLAIIVTFFARFRWKYHKYESLSHTDRVMAIRDSTQKVPARILSQKENQLTNASTFARIRSLPWEFLLSAFLAIGPLIALLIGLVSLLLQFQIKPVLPSRSDFYVDQRSLEPTAFYINYDATRYTTIASWTSSIALLLPGFLTTLIWYRLSQGLERDVSQAAYDRLLTPYQVSLLLNLKGGTLYSLWEYLRYVCSRGREKQAKFLSDAGCVVLISTLLGLGIWFADTWLHIATSTIAFDVPSEVLPDFRNSNGRSLFENCTSAFSPLTKQGFSCLLTEVGIQDLDPVLNDTVSYANFISGRDGETNLEFVTLGQDRIAYLAPLWKPQTIDFRASTVAVRSACNAIDRWCVLPNVNGQTNYSSVQCGKFVGENFASSDPVAQATAVSPGVVGVVTTFFKDQQWQDVMTIGNTSNSFFTVSRLDSSVKPTWALPAFGLASAATGIYFQTWIGCNTEFLNLTYTYVNGSIRAAEITPFHTLDLINTVFQPSLLRLDPFMTNGAALTVTANSSKSALNTWIDNLHRHYLSFAAVATDQTENIAEQTRSTILAARIPKAPLFTLGTLIGLSIILGALVLTVSLWNTRLSTTHSMQMIMTNAGLAAGTFDSSVISTQKGVRSAWSLFDESKGEEPSARIGIRPNGAGGHHFVAFVAEPIGGDDSSLMKPVTTSTTKQDGRVVLSCDSVAAEDIDHGGNSPQLASHGMPLLTR